MQQAAAACAPCVACIPVLCLGVHSMCSRSSAAAWCCAAQALRYELACCGGLHPDVLCRNACLCQRCGSASALWFTLCGMISRPCCAVVHAWRHAAACRHCYIGSCLSPVRPPTVCAHADVLIVQQSTGCCCGWQYSQYTLCVCGGGGGLRGPWGTMAAECLWTRLVVQDSQVPLGAGGCSSPLIIVMRTMASICRTVVPTAEKQQ